MSVPFGGEWGEVWVDLQSVSLITSPKLSKSGNTVVPYLLRRSARTDCRATVDRSRRRRDELPS